MLPGILRDLRWSLRRLRRNPVVSAVIILSLALGIGVNAAVFSIVNLALFRPLPVRGAEEMVRLYTINAAGGRYRAFSYPDYQDLRREAEGLTAVAAERFVPMSFSTGEQADLVWGGLVSGNYFRTFGVPPAVGRTLTAEDEGAPGEGRVAVLSHGLWERRFDGDPGVVGRNVVINGRDFTVVGVAREGFGGSFVGSSADVWVPLSMQREIMPVGDRLEARGARWLTVTARVEPGVSDAEVASRLGALAGELEQRHPETNRGVGIHLVPLEEDTLPFQARGTAGQASLLLLAVAAVVLLIACANLANLLQAETAARRHEVALRQAVGADRRRMVRQFLVEAVLYSLFSGGIALLLASALGALISRLPIGRFLPMELQTGVDWRVTVFTVALALVVGLLLGLVPALRSARFGLAQVLRGSDLVERGGRFRLRNVLVVGQVAFSLVLLICAALFVRSLQESVAADPGFDTRGVTIASLNLGLQGYGQEEGEIFYRRLLEELAARPGVESAALGEIVPLELGGEQQVGIAIPGVQLPEGSTLVADYNTVSPGYFETLGIGLLQGRGFDPAADGEGELEVVVNRAMAQRYWPDGDVIGSGFQVLGRPARVVGVVENVAVARLGESPAPYLYLNHRQYYEPAMVVHVRSAAERDLSEVVRRQVRSQDPDLPLFNVGTLQEHMRFALLPARLGAFLVGGFGLLALILTAVGTYGLMRYRVTRRRREIGIRRALGEPSRQVLKTVLWQGMSLILVGVVLGLVLGALAGSGLASALYGVQAFDLAVYLVTVGLLLAVALVAIYFPAREATRVEPAIVLREE